MIWSSRVIDPYARAVSSQCRGSACSPSESVSLLLKYATYRRFCHASDKFAPTEREARLIWSVSEYCSSRGKVFVISKMSCCSSNAALYTFKSLKLDILSLTSQPLLLSSFVFRLSAVVCLLPYAVCHPYSVIRRLSSVICL